MIERCFQCGKKLGKNPHLVDTRDAQIVAVGNECFKEIVAAGEKGWRHPKNPKGLKCWVWDRSKTDEYGAPRSNPMDPAAIDLDAPASIAKVNAVLKACGRDERLHAGQGHEAYFYDGEADGWFETTVGVGKVSHLTIRQHLESFQLMPTHGYNRDPPIVLMLDGKPLLGKKPRSNPWRFKADAPLEEGRKYPYRPRKPTEAEDLLEELDRQFEPLDEDEGPRRNPKSEQKMHQPRTRGGQYDAMDPCPRCGKTGELFVDLQDLDTDQMESEDRQWTGESICRRCTKGLLKKYAPRSNPAAADPFRNLEQDTQDALQHVEQVDENVPDYVWHVTKHPRMSLKKVLTLDDVSSWGEWAAGELKELSPEELFEHMRSFRGLKWAETALTWARDGFPAIVVVETPEYVGISDGRGRVSLAYGLGLTSIPVVMMKADPLPHQRG